MSWTMAVTMSNFLDRDFVFSYEIPCSTPPDYASHPDYKDRFGVLMSSKRSLVSDLLDIPNRRIAEPDELPSQRLSYRGLFLFFATTQAMKDKFEGTFLWEAFGVGREALIREELMDADAVEWTHTILSSPSAFYFLPRAEKLALMDTAKIKFRDGIEDLASAIIGDVGNYSAIHLRLGDFLREYAADEYSVDLERFARYIEANLPDRELPVLIATDGLQEKELFSRLLAGYKTIFIDELVFGEYRERYLELEFTDFNVLTILNELICTAADEFIGTYRSTLSSIIHRMRQERFGKRNLMFFPDGKISTLLNADFKIVPDSPGFFDWNRYRSLSADQKDIGWRREWDHQYTMIDV
jgi:hypothetical protein